MIKNLVFSGGGIKCISYIGVLKYLEENGLLEHVTDIVGSSGGAIFAFMVTIGYNYIDLSNLILQLDFDDLKDISTDNILNFFKSFGIDTGDKLLYLIKLLLEKKCGKDSGNITFKELYSYYPIKFTVTGTCLDTKCIEYFNYEKTPDMKVLLAIRISYSIPIIYNRVKYNGLTYVDGSVLENYPIDIYEDDIESTLGFYIEESSEIHDLDSLDQYILNILFSLSMKLQTIILEKYREDTVRIKCSISTIDFMITYNQKLETMNIGYETISKFFTKTSKFLYIKEKREKYEFVKDIILNIINNID